MDMTDEQNVKRTTSWLLFFIILILGYLISVFQDLHYVYLAALVAVIGFVIRYRNYFIRIQRSLFRVFIGTIFIFSGFVKGVDPVGTQYRIEDYFIAFGTEWAMPLALPLSVILNTFEFILGVMILFKIWMNLTSWLLLIMMSVFTLVTINDALYNPVPDCGCFGDALIITNWQTLYKNLVIDAMLIPVFAARKKTIRLFSPATGTVVFLLTLAVFIWFQVYSIRHLPVIDFRNWKVGKKLTISDPEPVQYYLTYRNKETGEEKEYLSPNYPYDDSTWLAKWEFVSQRVVDPNPRLHNLSIEDAEGNNYTKDVIENPGYQFMLVSYNLKKGNFKKIDEIRSFIDACDQNGVAFEVITASLPSAIEKFKEKHNLDADFYLADDITLMAMIRSNPGLILLRDAVVIDKWHHNDFPDFSDILKRFPEMGQ